MTYRTIRIFLFAAAALASVSSPAASDQARRQLAACSALTDRVATMIRAGDTELTRPLRPQLERCVRLQRAELDRAAREIVKRHKDIVR